jgi:hypothetical protein
MEEKQTGGILDENNPKMSVVNLSIIFATVAGFALLTYSVFNDKESAYFPISSIITVALGGVAIKAHKKTS